MTQIITMNHLQYTRMKTHEMMLAVGVFFYSVEEERSSVLLVSLD